MSLALQSLAKCPDFLHRKHLIPPLMAENEKKNCDQAQRRSFAPRERGWLVSRRTKRAMRSAAVFGVKILRDAEGANVRKPTRCAIRTWCCGTVVVRKKCFFFKKKINPKIVFRGSRGGERWTNGNKNTQRMSWQFEASAVCIFYKTKPFRNNSYRPLTDNLGITVRTVRRASKRTTPLSASCSVALDVLSRLDGKTNMDRGRK